MRRYCVVHGVCFAVDEMSGRRRLAFLGPALAPILLAACSVGTSGVASIVEIRDSLTVCFDAEMESGAGPHQLADATRYVVYQPVTTADDAAPLVAGPLDKQKWKASDAVAARGVGVSVRSGGRCATVRLSPPLPGVIYILGGHSGETILRANSGGTEMALNWAFVVSPAPASTPVPGATPERSPSPPPAAVAVPPAATIPAVSAATPSPTAAPTPVPTLAPTPVPTTVRTAVPTVATAAPRTPAPTALPTPSPTPAPTAFAGFAGGIANASGPVTSGFARFAGRVTDAATGLPIPGVCVYVGAPSGCPTPNLNTDTSGNFAFDFQIGTAALFNFEHPLYVTPPQRTGTAINLALVRR